MFRVAQGFRGACIGPLYVSATEKERKALEERMAQLKRNIELAKMGIAGIDTCIAEVAAKDPRIQPLLDNLRKVEDEVKARKRRVVLTDSKEARSYAIDLLVDSVRNASGLEWHLEDLGVRFKGRSLSVELLKGCKEELAILRGGRRGSQSLPAIEPSGEIPAEARIAYLRDCIEESARKNAALEEQVRTLEGRIKDLRREKAELAEWQIA
ncbi:MAG: hypothetical protein JSR76_01615 [Verrucomicrobia bacterium]|nr:hypothetical protein [Verrucomicrobiota bacterium]